MKTEKEDSLKDAKALVTVLDDIKIAQEIVHRLHGEGYSTDKIELVTHDVWTEAPEIETPVDNETAITSGIDGGIKGAALGGGLGAIAGLLTTVLTPFPGLGLAMIIGGIVAGGASGVAGGTTHAVEDDSVDLPSIHAYQLLVSEGNCLVVVLGNHEEVSRASKIVDSIADVRRHIHYVHGHEFHEHPSHKK